MVSKRLVAAAAVAAVLTACSGSGTPTPNDPSASPSDGRLTLGVRLPATGPDAALTPPMEAGIKVAVREINKAGGVNGERLKVVRGFVEETMAEQSVPTLLSRGADVVVGTGDSGSDDTASVVDAAVGAGIMFVTPSDAADALTQRDHHGLFWRTVAPDAFQAAVLADTLATEKVRRAALLVRQGADAEALAATVQATIEAKGGSTAGDPVVYGADSVETGVRQVRRLRPDGVVLVGGADSSVVQALVDQRVGPDRRPLFLTGGDLTPQLADGLADGALDGSLGLVPGTEVDPGFRKRLDAVDPELTGVAFAPEAYDAVVVSALAAVAAASDRPEAIAGQMVAVTTGGKPCDDFEQCRRLLGDSKDIDYDGPSGPIDFQADGNPGQAVMGVYEFEDGQWAPLQYVEGTVPPAPAPAP